MNTELGALRISELLCNARAQRASDSHFGGAERSALRIDGRLVVLEGEPISEAAGMAFLRTVLAPDAVERLTARGTADGALRSAATGPCRIHAYRQTGGVRIVVRLLSTTVPQLAQLELPPVIAGFVERAIGLVLVTGPTGSGKTTALAAMIDLINRTNERHIVTVEDPIEFVHEPIRSLITQCEIGRDVSDYAEALRGVVRADPDVLLIGEMRDRETMGAALTAAETGHLVFATLHTNDTAQTVDRIIDSFPSDAQNQIRSQFAAVLIGVVGLRLLPRRVGIGRRAAAEILVASDGVRNLIRENKTHQLRNAIVTGRDAGMQTLETHLSSLVERGEVTLAAARAVASRPNEVRDARRLAG